ncbi:arylamine N-acetyltransferase [Saccharothrix mutabilis subsp. mutabilis]|uniref:Arylamine N-acetyltransferase n=1 Tax=Saccharothrix mutabilis subsp. mutabilis TaxID=66855 RepID=A0ABN0TFA7_9PSEU
MRTLDVPALLRRIGAEAEPPSPAALTRLHQAFVERVPYEAVEVQLGRVTSLDPVDSLDRVLAGRGGYCFHLNGVFGAALEALGYRVTRHRAGVQMRPEDEPVINRNHVGLFVHDLDDCPWLVDVGLGDGLHAPLPLRAGAYAQGPFTIGLRPSELAPGGWRLDHDPRGSLHGVDFDPQPVELSTFADRHLHLSTSPESGFVRTFCAQRTDGSGWDSMRALTLSRVEETTKKTVLETPGDWFAALADVFGLVFTARERDVLWTKALAQHEAHVSSSRP